MIYELRIIKGKIGGMKLAIQDVRDTLDRLDQWANGIIHELERLEKQEKEWQ